MKIVIAGAGIAGLSTALSLHAAGFDDIEVYERSPVIRGLGVGINLLPHAMRELSELGIADRVEALGSATSTLRFLNRFGQLIWEEPRGRDAGYRWPQLSVHRGRLQLLLRDVVEERLGDVIRLGHRLTGVADGRDAARATFTTRAGDVVVPAEVLIGADGIHSALRALRYPADGEPSWSGLTLWRGTAVVAPFLDGRTMIMAGDRDQKFIAYPLQAPRDGMQLVNIIAERRTRGSADADWNRAVDPAPLRDMFRDWRLDRLDVPATIMAADEILEYPMVDRESLPRWSMGFSTLVGDAAHAMYPHGSNGGSQAILDARTLAHRLATSPSVAVALEQYDAARRPLTTALHARTRQAGPEEVIGLAHDRAPHGFDDISAVIPRHELERIAGDYKRAAGFDPDALHARPSLSVSGR